MNRAELLEYAKATAIQAGHAINANNGRCPLVEDALCKTTTLCCEVIRLLAEPAPTCSDPGDDPDYVGY